MPPGLNPGFKGNPPPPPQPAGTSDFATHTDVNNAIAALNAQYFVSNAKQGAFTGVKLDWGNDVVDWPGGSQTSNLRDIPHALGVDPDTALITGLVGGDIAPILAIIGCVFRDKTKIQVQAFSISGSPLKGQVVEFSWVVI